MIHSRYIMTFLVIAAAGILTAPAPTAASGVKAVAAAEKLDSLSHPHQGLYQPIVDSYIRKGLIGLGVLIRTPGEGTWNGTGGVARIEDSSPVIPETVFASLSVVKTYTAVAVMLLRDEGLIDIQATIDTYLSNDICDRIANGHTVTVLDLLRHSSGIPDFDRHIQVLEPWNNPYGWTWRDNLEKVYGQPARFVPGAKWEYTNINYLLLALIIDRITGSHTHFFSDRIFLPLGLTSTYYKNENGLPRPPGLVNFYLDRYADGYLENITEEICALSYNADFGYSGILATLTDNARFMEGFVNGELVGKETFLEMAEPLPFPGQEWRGLGFSQWAFTDDQGISYQLYATAGSSEMGYIEIIYLPDPGVSICTATNTGTTNKPTTQEYMTDLREDLLSAVFNRQAATNLYKKRNQQQKRIIKK